MYEQRLVRNFIVRAYDYINKLYDGAFDDVNLIVTANEFECSSYLYKYDEKTGAVINPRVRICIEEFDCDDFQTRHYNKEFGTKLEHKYLVVMLRILCHEMSHHLNIERYKDKEEEYLECLNYIQEIYEYGTEERKRAYRMIPEEYAADECAVKILSIHLNRLLALYRD